MELQQEGFITPAAKGKGRKKIACKSEWKRTKAKTKR